MCSSDLKPCVMTSGSLPAHVVILSSTDKGPWQVGRAETIGKAVMQIRTCFQVLLESMRTRVMVELPAFKLVSLMVISLEGQVTAQFSSAMPIVKGRLHLLLTGSAMPSTSTCPTLVMTSSFNKFLGTQQQATTFEA